MSRRRHMPSRVFHATFLRDSDDAIDYLMPPIRAVRHASARHGHAAFTSSHYANRVFATLRRHTDAFEARRLR